MGKWTIDDRRASVRKRIAIDGSGCWLWTGCIKPDGYGKFEGRHAHRVAYEVFVGEIPMGLQLDHLCRVLRCVNPEHLEPVTDAENKRRRYALMTHCKHGHEFTAANTYRPPGGPRVCRTCGAIRAARYQARKRATSAPSTSQQGDGQ